MFLALFCWSGDSLSSVLLGASPSQRQCSSRGAFCAPAQVQSVRALDGRALRGVFGDDCWRVLAGIFDPHGSAARSRSPGFTRHGSDGIAAANRRASLGQKDLSPSRIYPQCVIQKMSYPARLVLALGCGLHVTLRSALPVRRSCALLTELWLQSPRQVRCDDCRPPRAGGCRAGASTEDRGARARQRPTLVKMRLRLRRTPPSTSSRLRPRPQAKRS